MGINSRLKGAFIALLIAVNLFIVLPAHAAGRVALLIGNQSYSDLRFVLDNPANDIFALNAVLSRLGFSVEVLQDASSAQMDDALRRFANTARGAEFAVFFYAGHGVQMGGDNYLLGTDLVDPSAQGAARASITLRMIRDRLDEAKPRIGVIMIDACRDTPFRESIVGVQNGLAQTNGGAGLLIAYATDPGNVALDGSGANSTFTGALLSHIETPGLDVRLMFGRVRQQVLLESGGAQVPWVEEALIGEHSFSGYVSHPAASTPEARDIDSWRLASADGTPSAYRSYLLEFPNGLFSDLANMRLSTRAKGSATGQQVANAAERIIQRAGPQRVAAALDVLGHSSPSRSSDDRSMDVLPALKGYLNATARDSNFTWDDLLREASRDLVLLGATLARRIRTDMVALTAAGRAGDVAISSYEELLRLAQTNPQALELLATARANLDSIGTSQRVILERLDRSREYYARLLETAQTHFNGTVRDPAVISSERASEAIRSIAEDVQRDAQLFQKHVGISSHPRGTYKWLSDFLPR